MSRCPAVTACGMECGDDGALPGTQTIAIWYVPSAASTEQIPNPLAPTAIFNRVKPHIRLNA